jgi:hypothetical protein
MKIKILEDVTIYPGGDSEAFRVDVAAGQEIDVPDAYGEMLVKKGHAEKVGGKAQKSGE